MMPAIPSPRSGRRPRLEIIPFIDIMPPSLQPAQRVKGNESLPSRRQRRVGLSPRARTTCGTLLRYIPPKRSETDNKE